MKFNIFTLVFYKFEICLLLEIEIAENGVPEKFSAPRLIEKHAMENIIAA